MKCARLHLQERSKSKSARPDTSCYAAEKPLRYCQKRMINPEHEEDPRWTDIYERYRCDEELENSNDTLSTSRGYPETDDLFLSVQTLKFQGNSEEPKRLRRGFKYKCPSDGAKHRMFVKQIITDDDECSDDGRSSQLSSYYYDDYVKYIFNNDKSRPTSGKSSIFLQSLGSKKDNTTQVDEPMSNDTKLTRKGETKVKSLIKKCVKNDTKVEIQSDNADMDDTKITFHKSGRRKSLTISRTQSPETVQVIRVDVVRNHNRGSAMSEYEDKKNNCNNSDTFTNFDIENIDIKKSHFANKYLLTNTIKTLDESLSGGEKVTLLCKTFKLSERSQVTLMNKSKICPDVKQTCSNRKNASSHGSKAKILK